MGKNYIFGLVHMTRLAAMPMYGKKLKVFFTLNTRTITSKLYMTYLVIKFLKVCKNGNPELTLICFIARSNLNFKLLNGKS